jgi:hypothetical protein
MRPCDSRFKSREPWVHSKRPSGPTHRGSHGPRIRYASRQCGYRNRQSRYREHHRRRRESDCRESCYLCHRQRSRCFGQRRRKARNFREQGQSQEQLWLCAAWTTSFEMLAAASILSDRCRSVARTGGLRWMLKIYERALVIACPILLALTRHCGIWPNDVRRQQPDMHAEFLTSGLGSPTNMLRFGILIAASVLASSVASAGSRPLR